MGKSSFVNQKLGKNVSRKAGLLKSKLASHKKSNSLRLPSNFPAPKNEITFKKP